MSRTVTLSRPYDAVFDSTYTAGNVVSDPRVRAQVSQAGRLFSKCKMQYVLVLVMQVLLLALNATNIVEDLLCQS